MTDQPITPADEQVLEALAAAYSAGATDTHNWWAAGNVEREADFGEAASDYARSIDLTALAMRPEPDAVLREGWVAPETEPEMGPFDSRNFIVAVKRAHTGQIYVFPAQYLLNCPLWFEDEAKERAVTGWYGADCESDEIASYTPLLSNGDELMGWQPLPEWNALASSKPTGCEGERAVEVEVERVSRRPLSPLEKSLGRHITAAIRSGDKAEGEAS